MTLSPTPRRPRARSRLLALFLLVACAALALPGALSAQARATLQGTVTDPGGAPIPSAIVEIDLQLSSFRRGTTTDAAGRYRLTGLAEGRYRITIRRTGFRTSSTFILVGAGESLTQDYVLAVRTMMIDTIQVRADNPVTIERENTEFSTQVTEQAIQLLPLRTDPKEVVALTPGARPEQVWGGANQQANNYQIDGLSANHPGVGGDLISPSINWIESVEVRGLGAAAEFGNFQGGLVNINTKSGTNDFQGAFRVNLDAAALTASNLQRYDVTTEVNQRYDLEGEVRGPIVPNRLFYYLAGQYIDRSEQVVNHLRTRDGFHTPFLVDWTEQKYFGKLSWQPTRNDQLVLSGGYMRQEATGFGSSGFEAGAMTNMTAPTRFFNASFTHVLGTGSAFEVSAAGFDRDERREPVAGRDVPSVSLYGPNFRPVYQNAPWRTHLAPASLTVSSSLAWEMNTGGARHALKLGGEFSGGAWTHERVRNGGMTWRPAFGRNYGSFDPENTASWTRAFSFVPSEWGGETLLNADVQNGGVYLQDHIDLGPRISISPGVRYGWWTGWLTPARGVGTRFQAMHDQAFDARLGLTVDITGRNDFVLKAHAGRYHQSMFAQFYERAAGGNVFNNQQVWYHYGAPASPTQTFTPDERDQMAAEGRFLLAEEVRLNQTGPVDPNYRQPFVDQLVVGLEKQMGRWWKAELVYVGRQNENMVALVDRNAATNYTSFDRVRVSDDGGQPIDYNGLPLSLRRVYVPNNVLRDFLLNPPDGAVMPPGIDASDIPGLTWDPDYVITNVPEAERIFHQVQAVVRLGYPRYGGSVSLVWTSLRGNLDNISGYDDPAGFGAGPFVNPNQATHFQGRLANSSPRELKLWMYGQLPHGFRGGLFWTDEIGDRYTPTFTISSLQNRYRPQAGGGIEQYLLRTVAGQQVFVEERGALRMPNRASIDLHLERGVKVGGAEMLLTMDGFNVLGRSTPTRWNTSVNEGKNYTPFLNTGVDAENFYRAVRERVRPRSLRVGATVRF